MKVNPNEIPPQGNRDLEQIIRQKNSETKIGSLRKIYGEGFAPGYSSDTSLETVLNNSGTKTIREYLKRA